MRPEIARRNQGATAWIVLLVLLGVAGAALLVLQGLPQGAEEAPADAAEELPVADVPSGKPPADFEPLAAPVQVDDAGRDSEPESGAPTTGWISGHVQIDERLVGELEIYQAIVEEAVNDEAPGRLGQKIRRFEQRFRLQPDSQHARFEFVQVPFSKYGWRISVLAPGINGSQTVAHISARNRGTEVYLTLRKPIAVHVVVKDQERKVVPGMDVLLRPLGRRPTNRSVHRGKSDVYGLVMFDRVIQGKYELVVGPPNEQLPPKEIDVGSQKSPQFEPVVLPRGGAMDVTVVNLAGFGLEGVAIEAVNRDSKTFTKFETKTDKGGRARLVHLPPGRYWVHATKKGYERGFRRIKVEDKKSSATKVMLRYQ